MSKIDRTFQKLRVRGRSALIPFIMAGDPDLDVTEALVMKMAECGADIIELGVPFSDPLLDGPTIQAASHRALQKGIGLKEVFTLTKRLSKIDTPLVIMTYFNPVFRFGLKTFAKECGESGIDGAIIPDLPPEEAGSWIEEARAIELDTIFLTSPTSPLERIRRVCKSSRGFVYHVSITGVTGAREELPKDLEFSVNRLREQSKKPVAVGFGISDAEQIKAIRHFADGVIVGSAIVKIIGDNLENPYLITRRVGDFVSGLAKALRK